VILESGHEYRMLGQWALQELLYDLNER
jgi:hypothetical protein